MKSIILSVKPQEMANILNGEQKIIIKKTAPKETPFKVYLYCTKGKGKRKLLYNPSLPFSNTTISSCIDWGNDIVLNGKVVAEFYCEGIIDFYLKPIHITDLKIYDKPKKLEEFYRESGTYEDNDFIQGEQLDEYGRYEIPHYYKYITKPPQNFVYCEVVE